MNVETDAETIEKVKILALSDEFTLYCLNIFVKLENSNKENFWNYKSQGLGKSSFYWIFRSN